MSTELMSREFDAGVDQDQVMAWGGLYSVGLLPGTTWKALMVLGGIVFAFGALLTAAVEGWVSVLGSFDLTSSGFALVLAVPVAGAALLAAGFADRAYVHRRPPIRALV
jgi:hypothetical protein